MENNLENKTKFFALYWRQIVAIVSKGSYTHPEGTVHLVDKNVLSSVESEKYTKHKYSLELKPLSSISDEDAIHVARLAHQLTEMVKFDIKRSDNGRLIHLTWVDHIKRQVHVSINDYGCINTNWHFLETNDDTTKSFKINIGEIQTSSRRPIPYIAIVDYLRSQGYALPYMYLSVEEQVNRGWVKLKGE